MACMMALMLSRRGLPLAERAFCNPWRVMPISAAMLVMPLTRAMMRREDRSGRGGRAMSDVAEWTSPGWQII